MKVVVSANSAGLDGQASLMFGRCPIYVFVNTDTMAAESVENSAANAAGGAGIQAAQFTVGAGAEAVISGNLGPNAFNVFQAAGVPCYLFGGGTVREAVEALKSGKLMSAGGANVAAHTGTRAGVGGGRGGGRGMGTGRGMGMGMGRGMGMSVAPAAPAADVRAKEVAELRSMAGDLRKQLVEVMERLEKLDGEG